MYPEGLSPSGTLFFGMYLPKKRNRVVMYRVPASIAFWGQKAVCWDNPKPLKVSGMFLTSAVVSHRRCLLA